MNKSSNNPDSNSHFEQIKELLKIRLSQMHSYHDHKEKMAHAGILVALALMAAVFGVSSWPPEWVPDIHVPKRVVALFGLFLIWLFIHIYIRWQLRNRRVAALFVACLLTLLKDWAYKIPSETDLKSYEEEKDLEPFKTTFPRNSKILEYVDKFLFPVKSIFVPTDEGMRGYPTIMVARMIKTRTAAVGGELWVSLGSIFIFLMILFRSFQ